MEYEVQSIWESMKTALYTRTIRALEQDVADASNLDEALRLSLDQVVRAAHAQVGSVWFYDRYGDGRIHARAAYGGADVSALPPLAPGEGIAGQVVMSGKSTIVQDCQSDPRWAGKADRKTGFKTLTMICVPLRHREHTFGCIQIINKTDDTLFDAKDLDFAEALAAKTAELFIRYHLLDGYTELIEEEAQRAKTRELTFSELFSAKSFSEVETNLLKLDMYSRLDHANQMDALRLSRELWRIFDKTRPVEKKKRGFRLF